MFKQHETNQKQETKTHKKIPNPDKEPLQCLIGL